MVRDGEERSGEKEMKQLTLKEVKEFYSNPDCITTPFIHPHNALLYNEIMKLKPTSIFEFGCNWGQNLQRLKFHLSKAKLFGIDLNKRAIKLARGINLDVKLADEKYLKKMPDNAYDIVFTCSVLNHLPPRTITSIIKHLKRIASKHVLLMECTQKDEPRWWTHSYSKYGFKHIGFRESRVIKANYDLFWWEK